MPDDVILGEIARGASLQELRQIVTRAGYTTLRADGMEKVKGGLTTAEEVFYVTSI
ncbi:MAG TPA: hypothetical protein PK400_04050 [Phycisphaerales bacterium]|nr:hypothetical protein [Phycisphaerales bacterium]